MTAPNLQLEGEKPARPFWRRWKWVALALFLPAILLRPWLPGIVVAIGYLCGFALIANLLFYLGRYLRDRLFWRVRHRLLASFVFVGLIPIVLLLALALLFSYLMLGQLASTYFTSSIRELQVEVAGINGELAGSLRPGTLPASFESLAGRVLRAHTDALPRTAARLLKAGEGPSFERVAAFDPSKILKEEEKEIPAGHWLAGNHDFDGILVEGNTVLITSLKPVAVEPGYYVELTVPLDAAVVQRLAREKSLYVAIVGAGDTNVRIDGSKVQVEVNDKDPGRQEQVNAETDRLIREMMALSDEDRRRMVPFANLLEGKKYQTGESDVVAAVLLRVPLAVLYSNYLAPSDLQGQVVLTFAYVLAGLFLFVEVLSLIIGLTISRRVTRSVNDMYQGTVALKNGDLQYRIPVRRKDQLGLLAHSFNQMSSSITRLLEEVSEKKRLEQELEIAREVQATLFPKQLPHSRGMTIFGGCEAARTVSGDYYDFIVEDELRLHVVTGDISGKGISAALLMANLQAAMRSQLLSVKSGNPADIENSMASVMVHLNQQIHLNSPPEKYATLFAGRYDAETRRLCYSNAGHLAPILISGGDLTRLQPTGTVLGLLPDQNYEARSIELQPGTLLVIFTDGITEAVNSADEEFGEERLIEMLNECRSCAPDEIYRRVVARVRQWQGDLKQHDDITLIVARAA